jgi:hypothetical protein
LQAAVKKVINRKFIELFGCAIRELVQSLNASEIFLTSFTNKSIKPYITFMFMLLCRSQAIGQGLDV